MDRRSFVKKSLIGSLGISLGLGAYASLLEPFWLDVVRVKMPLQNLPHFFEGKTIMQISDIHVCDKVNIDHLKESCLGSRPGVIY